MAAKAPEEDKHQLLLMFIYKWLKDAVCISY